MNNSLQPYIVKSYETLQKTLVNNLHQFTNTSKMQTYKTKPVYLTTRLVLAVVLVHTQRLLVAYIATVSRIMLLAGIPNLSQKIKFAIMYNFGSFSKYHHESDEVNLFMQKICHNLVNNMQQVSVSANVRYSLKVILHMKTSENRNG